MGQVRAHNTARSMALALAIVAWALSALLVVNPKAARAEGDIGPVIDTEEFDTSDGGSPEIINVGTDTFAIAYSGSGSDGFLKTYTVDSSGAITSPEIDSLEFDTSNGSEPDIIHVSGDVYAIAYRGQANDGFLVTVTISAAGAISNSVIDTEEFDPSSAFEPSIVHVSGDVYAIAYRGPQNDGFIKTVTIGAAGAITAGALDTFEFDTSDGTTPDIINVSGTTFAVAYQGSGGDGFVKTVTISALGIIVGLAIDTFEFDTTDGITPEIQNISGTTYLITYQGTGGGYLKTITISALGTITNPAVDTEQFDTTATAPRAINVGTDTYAVVYSGVDADGFVKTYTISAAGAITNPAIDSLEFDTADTTTPSIVHVSGDVYGIAYTGTASDGFLKTLAIGEATLEQSGYRIFGNTNSTDVAAPLAALNTPASLTSPGDAFRIRMLLHRTIADLSASGETFKLQYVDKGVGSCASPSGGTPAVYTDVTAGTLIAYNDNAAPSDGATLTANASDPTHGGDTVVNQTYEELNTFTNSVAAIPAGQDGMWDFSLIDNGAATGSTYCTRIVLSSGTPLDTYTVYPEITIPGTLDVSIVDAGGTTVASPKVTLSSANVMFQDQVVSGVFGTVGERIRVSNNTGAASWGLSIAATLGAASFWDGPGASDYDFNDPTANAGDGGDADAHGGQMTVDPSVATITPEGGCSTTGISLGSSTSFSEGVTDTISLMTAGGTADTGCYWDLTGVGVSQTLPAQQGAGTYNIDMTVTVVAM